MIRLCGHDGGLEVLDADLDSREPAFPPPPPVGTGRELFAFMRAGADDAERGGSAMLHTMEEMA
jgi:phosphogluconate dehydratase